MKDKTARVENAGKENERPDCKGVENEGKYGNYWISQVKENAGMEIAGNENAGKENEINIKINEI